MSEVQPTPEVMVPLNTFSIPLAVLLMDGKDKPDGLGLSKFLGYAHLPKSTRPMRVIDTVRVFDPESIMASGGFYIKWLHDNAATLPYRYWADRLALTAAWVIEHSEAQHANTLKVQSAIVFRETRAAGPVWKIRPDGEYLSIQVVHGPRSIRTTRWRISDGVEVADNGVPFPGAPLRLPTLGGYVESSAAPEVALLNALDAAGFVKVVMEGGVS